MARHPNSTDYLMDMRILTLRIIADVWDDDKNSAAGASVRQNLTKKGKSSENIKAYITERNYDPYVFKNLSIKFIGDSANWDSGKKAWGKPQGESILICLPSFSGGDNSVLKKIMQYYEKFPTFLGSDISPPPLKIDAILAGLVGALRNNHQIVPEALNHLDLSLSDSTILTGDNYNLGVSQDNFLSFGAVLLRVIARAQVDLKFRGDIEYNLGANPVQSDLLGYYSKINGFLEDDFNFVNPWEFGIGFVFAAASESDYNNFPNFKEKEGYLELSLRPFWKDGEWVGEQVRSVIGLELPKSPESDDTLEALTAYNCIGPRYPFTCS